MFFFRSVGSESFERLCTVLIVRSEASKLGRYSGLGTFAFKLRNLDCKFTRRAVWALASLPACLISSVLKFIVKHDKQGLLPLPHGADNLGSLAASSCTDW